MTKWVCVALALTWAGPPARGAVKERAPRWLEDYAQARRVAKESGRPLFVVFRCEH